MLYSILVAVNVIVWFGLILYLALRGGSLKDKLIGTEAELQTVALEKVALEKKLQKVTSQKKSSEVRTGLIAEQMAPFLEGFPYDPKKSKFLGQPIDFISFDESGVHFVEVKSGKARLSKVQRQIRDQIKKGSITFEIYRVEGE